MLIVTRLSADDKFVPPAAYYHRRKLKIDRDYRKYDRVIAEMQAREDELAVTFVEKVRIPRCHGMKWVTGVG